MSPVTTLQQQRAAIPYMAVLIQCLRADGTELPGVTASGFVRAEGTSRYLYTCWHVVSGFDPNNVKIGMNRPDRRHLLVSLQATHGDSLGQAIGGLQTMVVPLYASDDPDSRRLWQQDDLHIPHPDLNAVGLHVPFYHDVVRIRLADDHRIANLLLVDEKRLSTTNLPATRIGEKCLIVGYPYGFSAFGPDQPIPVALTRFIAAAGMVGRQQQLLLESPCAPGMSGGPVYLEANNELTLLGMYTGAIYPDFRRKSSEPTTALGTVADLSLVFAGHMPFTDWPARGHPRLMGLPRRN